MSKIRLSNGLDTEVSDEDAAFACQWGWHPHRLRGEYYARRKAPNSIYLDEEIVSKRMKLLIPKGAKIVHLDSYTLNNKRENLKVVTIKKFVNDLVESVTGVSWNNGRDKWQASIRFNCRNIILGYFDSKDIALKVIKAAEIKYYGTKIQEE